MYDWVYIYEFAGDLTDRIPVIADEDYIGFWKEGAYSFVFFRRDKKPLLQAMDLPFRSELIIRHEDWESGSSIDVLHLGRITIHPPWKSPAEEGDIQVCIDPNMAFGSGYHATTRGCLALIDKLFYQSIPERVLDLGTGTGILSIACLKMGSRAAYCIDHNNLSIDTARRNRELNGFARNMHVLRGDVRDFLYIDADLLIGNLHFQLLDEVTDQEAFYRKRYYVLSGLMGSEGHRIEEKLRRRLTFLERYQENLWFSYLFQSS